MNKEEAWQLGRLFKRTRRTRGLSLREVDHQSTASYHWLSRLERGTMKSPAASKLTSVAGVIGVPLDQVDRITRGQLSRELPPIRTYFSVKYHLTTDEIRQVEEVFDRIRRNRRGVASDLDEHLEEGRRD